MNKIQIVGTGLELLKSGIRGIEPVIEEMIHNAKKDIHMMAYVFTPPAIHILKILERKAEEGVNINIIIDHLESREDGITSILESMKSRFAPYVKIVDFSDETGRQLHAKVVVTDRNRAVIGSANFSWRGMVNNYEIGVLVEGETAWDMAHIIDHFVYGLREKK